VQSSVEVFDTRAMRHVGTHSVGFYPGSLTWIDRHDGAWWAASPTTTRCPTGRPKPYGGTDNTQVVKMDDDFQVSWGPDGRLWLSGHDLGEAYVMTLPPAGSELTWVATVGLPNVEGQGIAWDRSGAAPTLWAIKRSTKQAFSFSAPYRSITTPADTSWHVYGPGEFQQ
jgi:hypothetical protein